MNANLTNYGHFDDRTGEYVITDPLTPAPWINYLGNRRLHAFVSQQAGGLCWHKEPQTRRITRYQWLATPPDRPGFYLYVRDRKTSAVWNPHFAPTCTAIESYECRHAPGMTTFSGTRDGVRVAMRLFIPPGQDVLLWDVRVENLMAERRRLTLASFVEFGLLDAARELWWCYLKNQIAFRYEEQERWIRYDYRVFQAPYAPAIFLSCTEPISGFECSRDAFCGKGGSLERPHALVGEGWTFSQLPGGGHGVGVLGVEMDLPARGNRRLGYVMGVAPDWKQAGELRAAFSDIAAFDRAQDELQDFWSARTSRIHVQSGDRHFDRMVNSWNPVNCEAALNLARSISTDHMGTDGLRFRDTMQDALAMTLLDPARAAEVIKLVLSFQGRDGSGVFAFWPDSPDHRFTLQPLRCDNTVWPVLTVDSLIRETGDSGFLNERVSFRDGGEETVFDHLLLGLRYIDERRGPHGLPLLFHADWNDSLAVFHDERAESVMLGMQMIHAANLLAEWAQKIGKHQESEWCRTAAARYHAAVNADGAWDGQWYARLLLSNGKRIGSGTRAQGCIYLEPQAWAVISGAGDYDQRGRLAMDKAREHLNTARGLMICSPPYTGIPEPGDRLIGNAPGAGENGGIFCHANTWAIMAECLLDRADRAYEYYRKMLPSVASEELGQDQWGREPYVLNSTVTGPAQGAAFGRGGISWLTGTASWMYWVAVRYMLGFQSDGQELLVRPCLPASWPSVVMERTFRGENYRVVLKQGESGVSIETVKKSERL